MFVFILISAELAILYTVFWYLYLREPRQARRISGDDWGSYNQATTSDGISAVKPFMVPQYKEMILDLRTNHYVPLPEKRRTMLSFFAQQLDDCMSELNVRA